ncbi:hypothetical protein Y032_0036g3165 [Ancylostoma ceylanicum]|uniref:Uncharacterized protein n=1 Tax=Ancylostoma ceylanicum TaxID=53326 RepID=A0A016UJD4_9BILA|nr:hypothetical protein Y032_0036g3165 [Ancylostoma ceylanicum]
MDACCTKNYTQPINSVGGKLLSFSFRKSFASEQPCASSQLCAFEPPSSKPVSDGVCESSMVRRETIAVAEISRERLLRRDTVVETKVKLRAKNSYIIPTGYHM